MLKLYKFSNRVLYKFSNRVLYKFSNRVSNRVLYDSFSFTINKDT